MKTFRIGHQSLNPPSVAFANAPVTATRTKQVLVDKLMGDGPTGDSPVQILNVSLSTSGTAPQNHVLLIRYTEDGKSKTVTVPMDGQGI